MTPAIANNSQDAQKDKDSPSASSIFLPLGRKARRDSKASLSHELDQDALNQALNHIHTAASQSNNLTVFNDYTDPPTAASYTEGKSLASEIQGGITGLYNKFKASVGGNKDEQETHFQPALSIADDRASSTSKLSSGLTSRAPSPCVAASDPTPPTEPPSSKISSKATSISKPSVPPTPAALRSPIGPSQSSSHIVDPFVTSVNIHAIGSVNHSRTGSALEIDSPQHRSLTTSADSDSLRKALQKPPKESSFSDRSSSILTSPVINARGATSSHERGLSTTSTQSQSHFGNTDGLVSPPILLSPQDEKPLRAVPSKQEAAHPQRLTNPLDLLAENASHSSKPNVTSQVKSPELSGVKSPGSTNFEKRPADKLAPKISQSRLPGFHMSRTASSESSVSAGLLRANLDQQDDDNRSLRRIPRTRSINKLRSKLLSKEFWMRDENAKDCFHCGEQFTTFRRKHHCRTCGQIFDNKCTVLISGNHFGSSSPVRVCKPCESIITSHDDDSSDDSIEDLALIDSAPRPRTPEPPTLNRALARFEDDNMSVTSQSLEQMARTPTMNFPVRRAYDGANRNSAILEFDVSDRPLPRPSSSRSLKATHSIGHGHKRHHSRHQHIRNFKSYHDDRAPFQRRGIEEGMKEYKSSAFHRDSIIDPDLAQYLSDDPSTDEEQSIEETMGQDKLSRSGPDSDRSAIGGLLAAVRKGRSRFGDRSIAGFLNLGKDSDEALKGSRKRNLSVSSSIHRGTPRTTKERLQIVIPGSQDDGQESISDTASIYRARSRMIRSASMHGLAAPAMELNRASIQHVHKMLQQLLRDDDVPQAQSWEDALVPILLRATDDVDPDVQGGDDIDIRNYVKLKKVPGGRPGDTAYISGLIFTKNVALKSMARSLTNPKILIITFAIEYARHEAHFMSLDPVIRQEREYLTNLVGRIAALKPDLLLAQRNISGLALEMLEKANITTIFNVKSSVLEAVSRCTQGRIAQSMDKLTSLSNPFGSCDSFEVRTFVAGGRRKTYVYFSGCPAELGCTIALRGADEATLSKIKRITEFMVYVVYNLKLETCLMRDEFALIPSAPTANGQEPKTSAGLAVKAPGATNGVLSQDGHMAGKDNHSPHQGDVSNTEKLAVEKEELSTQAVRLDSTDSAQIPDDIPVPTFYEDLVLQHETRILSASPFVKFMQPYLLMRARELERRVAYLKRLRDQDRSDQQMVEEKGKASKFTLIQPDMVHRPLAGATKKVREIIHAVHDAEYEKATYNYETQKKQWETYLSGNRNLFDPVAHQNIVVLFSLLSTETSVPCSGPASLALSFYNEHETEAEFEADCTLGQYVEDLCYRANERCPSDSCEKRMHEHHRQYVHGEAQINVFVHPYPAKMRGFQEVILMWSQCRICGVETTVNSMSPSTWKYSFGKYLELSFWSADLHARAGICPHDLHRDHLRYFGFKEYALRVHYDPIDLLEIVVPRPRLTWKVDNDLKFRNEIFSRMEHRITKFMISVKLRLKNIGIEAVQPEKADVCREEIEKLTKRANEEHASLVKQLQERYTNSKYWETIPLNAVVRKTQEKVTEWDDAFADFEKNYLPSEKDIRRLATLQLKKIFLDRDVSVTTLKSDDEGTTTPPTEEIVDEKDSFSEKISIERSGRLSPEKTQSFLQSVVEEHATSSPQTTDLPTVSEVTKSDVQSLPSVLEGPRNVEDVKHLDLAIATPLQPAAAIGDDVPLQVPISPRLSLTSDQSARKDSVVDSSPEKAAVSPQRLPDATQDERNQSIDEPHASLRDANLSPTARRTPDLKSASPTLSRAHSQPAGSIALRSHAGQASANILSGVNTISGFTKPSPIMSAKSGESVSGTIPEKKLSDRLGLSHLKNKTFSKGQSLIPRAVSHRKESRVSNLAKHFEQLSREFERERVRERRLRAAKSMQSRVYPMPVSKPIVEVFKDVDEAVNEHGDSDDGFGFEQEHPVEGTDQPVSTAAAMVKVASREATGFQVEEPPPEAAENETDAQVSAAPSEVEDETDDDDTEEEILLPDSPEDLMRMSQEDIDLKELPKHERTSLMKMLTNFWAERSSSGWTALEYPLVGSEHIFADCDIIVREDEPSSIIAFALDSQDYNTMLDGMQNEPPQKHTTNNFSGHDHAGQSDVMHSLLRKTGRHLKYQFQEGAAKMMCKMFFAEQFDAVRRKCGVADRFVESLSRCLKWDSKGGKTKSVFLKTLDDRFILKSLSPIETQSFLKFAPNYFQIMSEAFFHELPSVIAKMFGFYQIIVTNKNTGVEYNWFLLVMENLFYDRVPTRIFDLKGSMRNRKMEATGEEGEVLLDENMVDFIYESPLFVREHSKKLLRSSVHNDTLFLARQNVMDYSLMVAIDANRKELVVGIIDCIRTYTWDKKLESWIKDRGLVPVRGKNNRPTVTSPREYKKRFREAMGRYYLEAPDCWHMFRVEKAERRVVSGSGRVEKVVEGQEGDEEKELQVLT